MSLLAEVSIPQCILAAGIIFLSFVSLLVCGTWAGDWMKHREQMANARAAESSVRNRILDDHGRYCPKCGTVTALKKVGKDVNA